MKPGVVSGWHIWSRQSSYRKLSSSPANRNQSLSNGLLIRKKLQLIQACFQCVLIIPDFESPMFIVAAGLIVYFPTLNVFEEFSKNSK